MEKTAIELLDDRFEKIAASFDARRKKQYWQMLKKMHGGNDEAVRAITSKGKPFELGEFKRNAIIVPNVISYDKPRGFERQHTIFSPANYDGATIGKKMRLKTPSELWGSKTLYPKTSKFSKTTNLNMNPRSMDEVTRDVKYRGATNGWSKYYENNRLGDKRILGKEDKRVREIAREGKRGEAFRDPSEDYYQDSMIISRKLDIPKELTTDYNNKEVVDKLLATNGLHQGKFGYLERYISKQKQKPKSGPTPTATPKSGPTPKSASPEEMEEIRRSEKQKEKKKKQKQRNSIAIKAGLGLSGVGAIAKKTIQENNATSSLVKKNKLRDRAMPALAGLGAAGTAYGYGTDKAAFEIVDDILSK